MVETALVMSVFTLMLFGVFDYGRALYSYHMVDNAARIGSRFAIVHGSACVHTASPDTWPCDADATEIQNYVRSQSVELGPADQVTVTTAWGQNGGANPGCEGGSPYNAPGCLVTVSVSYPFNFALPFISTLTLTMTSSSAMIISQ